MRPRLALLVGALLLGLLLWVPAAAAAPIGDTGPAADEDTPVSTLGEQPTGGGIIPRPDSGIAPDDAGDRGGPLQTVLLVLVVGGVVFIAALVARESKRARAERGF